MTELVDEARHRDALARRSGERWLRQQAQDRATLSGVLLSAGEHATTVAVRTSVATVRSGTVRGVGLDHVALACDEQVALLRLGAVTMVTLEPGTASTVAGAAREGFDRTFDEALANVAAELSPVALTLTGGGRVSGVLRSVGEDVATIATDAGIVFVPLGAIAEALVPDLG